MGLSCILEHNPACKRACLRRIRTLCAPLHRLAPGGSLVQFYFPDNPQWILWVRVCSCEKHHVWNCGVAMKELSEDEFLKVFDADMPAGIAWALRPSAPRIRAHAARACLCASRTWRGACRHLRILVSRTTCPFLVQAYEKGAWCRARCPQRCKSMLTFTVRCSCVCARSRMAHRPLPRTRALPLPLRRARVVNCNVSSDRVVVRPRRNGWTRHQNVREGRHGLHGAEPVRSPEPHTPTLPCSPLHS